MATVHVLAVCAEGEMMISVHPNERKAKAELHRILKDSGVEGSTFDERWENAADNDIHADFQPFEV